MTYEEFRQYVCKGMYETIYDDSEGREILVIEMLDAYDMMNKAPRKWAGLTDDEIDLLEELYAPPVHPDFVNDADHCLELIRHVEAKLKEKNT